MCHNFIDDFISKKVKFFLKKVLVNLNKLCYNKLSKEGVIMSPEPEQEYILQLNNKYAGDIIN